jgi:oligoendopeptidase F
VDGSEKLIAQQTILWKGKELPLHEALGRMGALPSSNERQRMHALILEKMKAISYFIEHEINAIVTDKKINDQLRHFEHPFSATILDYENDEMMVVGLMDTLNRHQKISHQLSQIKQKLMGGDKLSYADMGVTLAASKQTFSFERGVALVRRAFAKAHPVYVEIFDRFLEQGQIDVYPRTGKRGGGYCWGGYGRPTYVLLNWTDDLRSVTTLAHEMGHAIHRELSKSQSVLYEHHPISTSEVASTLFENFVFEEILEELPEKDRLYARFNRLQDAVATILRQSAYFEFEKELHLRIREQGYLGHESIAQIMYQQLKKHLGPAYVLKPEDGYLFVRYMHARWFFYVYSYAYGHLMSTTLFTHLQQDPQAIEKINEFLSSGGRFSPEEIFKKIGYDTSRPEFWEEGLRALEQEIQLLKRDARKLNYY